MQVKLCSRCPYSPRDLADHYDIDAALHLCAACDARYDPCKTLRRPTCRTKTSYPTSKASLIEPHAALSVTETSGSFAIIAAAGPSVQPGVSSVSGYAEPATAGGCGDFELLDEASKGSSFQRAGISKKVPAC